MNERYRTSRQEDPEGSLETEYLRPEIPRRFSQSVPVRERRTSKRSLSPARPRRSGSAPAARWHWTADRTLADWRREPRLAFANRQRRFLPSRRSQVIAALICVCVLAGSITGILKFAGFYQHDLALAYQGLASLQTAEAAVKQLASNPLNKPEVSKAQQAFADAYSAFSQVNGDLSQIPGIATIIPHYGTLLNAALHLAPIAAEASQAGMLGCDALNLLIERLSNPLSSQSQGITMDDLGVLDHEFAQVQQLFNVAATQIKQLGPDDLQIDPRLGPAISAFKTALPQIQTGIQNVQTVLTLAPVLLGVGKPTSYLVEVLDSTELRPGGGFIGNYGILTMSGGRLGGLTITDTDLLDRPFEAAGHVIPIPAAYPWFRLVPSWSLRDSNLDADFPTSARNGEQTYHIEGGTVDVQGVIAITPWLIANMLKVTGPIYVPEYKETVTAANLVDRIHYHQLLAQEGRDDVYDPTSHTSLRKRFTGILFEHFLARIQQIASTAMPQFFHLFINSLHTKDVQVYLNAAPAEAILQQYHVGATIEAPPTGDSLFVVDANIIANKANYFIQPTIQDQVTLDASGNATHTTTLTYTWPPGQATLNVYGSGPAKTVYRDFVRVYVPPGSVLETQQGWKTGGTSLAFGREVWAGVFILNHGQTGTITLTWQEPKAATHNASGWHYHDLIQRQAGFTWQLNLQVTLPSCASFHGTPGGMTLQGKQSAVVQHALTEDLNLDVEYTC